MPILVAFVFPSSSSYTTGSISRSVGLLQNFRFQTSIEPFIDPFPAACSSSTLASQLSSSSSMSVGGMWVFAAPSSNNNPSSYHPLHQLQPPQGDTSKTELQPRGIIDPAILAIRAPALRQLGANPQLEHALIV